MTENEAIRDLEYLIEEYSAYPPETGVNETIGSLQYCITALREIQQYREIGTVEECREAAELKHERSQSTEALVYQTPTTVMLICPYCDHENDYEYDDFCSDNGAPPDWDYTKIECEECHRIFQIQGQDWQ